MLAQSCPLGYPKIGRAWAQDFSQHRALKARSKRFSSLLSFLAMKQIDIQTVLVFGLNTNFSPIPKQESCGKSFRTCLASQVAHFDQEDAWGALGGGAAARRAALCPALPHVCRELWSVRHLHALPGWSLGPANCVAANLGDDAKFIKLGHDVFFLPLVLCFDAPGWGCQSSCGLQRPQDNHAHPWRKVTLEEANSGRVGGPKLLEKKHSVFVVFFSSTFNSWFSFVVLVLVAWAELTQKDCLKAQEILSDAQQITLRRKRPIRCAQNSKVKMLPWLHWFVSNQNPLRQRRYHLTVATSGAVDVLWAVGQACGTSTFSPANKAPAQARQLFPSGWRLLRWTLA